MIRPYLRGHVVQDQVRAVAPGKFIRIIGRRERMLPSDAGKMNCEHAVNVVRVSKAFFLREYCLSVRKTHSMKWQRSAAETGFTAIRK